VNKKSNREMESLVGSRAFERVVETCSRILEEADDADAFFWRAAAKWGLGARSAAIGDFDESLRVDPNSGPRRLTRAFKRIDIADYPGAIDDANRLIELDRESGRPFYSNIANFLIAYCCLQQHQYTEALEALESVSETTRFWFADRLETKEGLCAWARRRAP